MDMRPTLVRTEYRHLTHFSTNRAHATSMEPARSHIAFYNGKDGIYSGMNTKYSIFSFLFHCQEYPKRSGLIANCLNMVKLAGKQ